MVTCFAGKWDDFEKAKFQDFYAFFNINKKLYKLSTLLDLPLPTTRLNSRFFNGIKFVLAYLIN